MTLLILAISPWVRIKFIKLASDRIGHYAWVTEQFLCAKELCVTTEKRKPSITVFYRNPGAALANAQLDRMWKRVIPILPFPYLMAEVDRYLLWASKTYRDDPLKTYFTAGDGCDRWNLLGKIDHCHTYFTQREKNKGRQLTQRLGIPDNAPYVCILGRDSRYLSIHMPNVDSSYHDYRNVNIENYKNAAEFLVSQGYYVVRMGKHVKDAFHVNHPNVIDYATSAYRSDFMDIYLSAHCAFFISVGTGLDAVAQIFRRPLLITNFPLSNRGVWPDWCLFMPKKIYDSKNNRYLSFKEIYTLFSNSEISASQITRAKGLQFIENTPEEITEGVKELIDRLQNNAQYSAIDEELQQRFWQDYPQRFSDNLPLLKIPVFEYTRMMQQGRLRMAKSFLRNNAALLH
jgi:putative glycosyltransferase (TIGR04372 family)